MLELSGFWVFVLMLLALLLDRLLGEPVKFHPLIGFGNLAIKLERYLNVSDKPNSGKLNGIFAWLLLVLPLPFVIALLWYDVLLESPLWLKSVLVVVSVYFSIGWQSLREHGQAVVSAFAEQGLLAAKAQVSRIVSRDTEQMDEAAVSRATIESMLENGSDAVFAPIFWFLVAGPAGAVLYRLTNTLDAMWGYRTPRYESFGWCSAKLDDVLNWVPARLTALSYALLGKTTTALHCWQQQAKDCASPNGGPVMCSGAGALGIELGGGAFYHGQWQARSVMGEGRPAMIKDISRSIQLVDKTVILWMCAWLMVWFIVWAKG